MKQAKARISICTYSRSFTLSSKARIRSRGWETRRRQCKINTKMKSMEPCITSWTFLLIDQMSRKCEISWPKRLQLPRVKLLRLQESSPKEEPWQSVWPAAWGRSPSPLSFLRRCSMTMASTNVRNARKLAATQACRKITPSSRRGQPPFQRNRKW